MVPSPSNICHRYSIDYIFSDFLLIKYIRISTEFAIPQMETDEVERIIPFQLQFDKPLSSQVRIAEWNPGKDLLAMVTEDSKILLHRFNWQRLWAISPGRRVTSLCWRPDGKAVAVGLEDGTISFYDVENGKLLRSIKSHSVAVLCLDWAEDVVNDFSNLFTYEDRSVRLFPSAPRIPRIPGVASNETTESEDTSQEFLNYLCDHFSILCSGDKDGSVCFTIFGIFSIAKVNVSKCSIICQQNDDNVSYRLVDASVLKVTLSKDLRHTTVMCSGRLIEETWDMCGLHCFVLETSIFQDRKGELHQLAKQATSIEDLTEVIRASLFIMHKQWYDAMRVFQEKFSSLPVLMSDHGLDSSPQDEFLRLLCGSGISHPLHQFLVNSLGEAGAYRLAKVISDAAKEIQLLILNHLQPAADLIAFRIGELHGFSKWESRFSNIGLIERLSNDASEKAGMFLVQVVRFVEIILSVVQQFSNFFCWVQKCIRLLMSESTDTLLPNSELVVIFLRGLYDQDPVKQFLEISEDVQVNLEALNRVKELVHFGGFSDTEYLRRTLAKEFQLMESSLKEVFLFPLNTVSEKIKIGDFLPLFPFSSSLTFHRNFSISMSHYNIVDDCLNNSLVNQTVEHKHLEYISFKIPAKALDGIANCVSIVRWDFHESERGMSFEAVLIHIPDGYSCTDISFYKECQIAILLDECGAAESLEKNGKACLAMVKAEELPFMPISDLNRMRKWMATELMNNIVNLQLENVKARWIPRSVLPPLAVSAERGVACVFADKRRAMVFLLDEDETDAY